ncbi:MAG: threonine synthase [Methylacidiphilales bacterium]|nr:threonine synthase [Candidatus Methylacidiphilales bacterium]MDW8349143.1 threonine synthase [Verrucomicrobiae bacterium]
MKLSPWPGVIRAYADRLPVTQHTPIVTLLEGNTPLIPLSNFCKRHRLDLELYVKYEALNPTASFKDRGMTLAVSKAVERGAQILVCASTGNTSASAAAYAARAGIRSVVIIPYGKIALGKLAQALIYGAQIIAIEGNFDDALHIVQALGSQPTIEVVNSINPVRIEGQKTAAFEICDHLGRAPDVHALPVGNAGNITAYWKGYQEYHRDNVIRTLPRMFGFQAAGAAPIVEDRIIEHPETIATAIRIGNPASWQGAKRAIKESHGHIDKITDAEILENQKALAQSEGLFVEPACAVALAGIRKAFSQGLIPSGALVVATMTGHGLKDPQTAIEQIDIQPHVCPPDVQAVLKLING